MTCNSCVSNGFGRKVNPNAAKAMKLKYERGISLGEAWKIVKSGGGSKRRSTRRKSKRRSTKRKSKRRSFGRRHRKASRISHAKNSLKLTRKKLKRKARKSRRKSRKMSRKFGASGPGFAGQTSYGANGGATFFGKAEPFTTASSWWYPHTGGQMQGPQNMLMKN